MKATVNNVINLWFAADTPIRQYKIKLNPEIWAACKKVSEEFSPPSGRLSNQQYRKSDKASFARAVLEELNQTKFAEEEEYHLA